MSGSGKAIKHRDLIGKTKIPSFALGDFQAPRHPGAVLLPGGIERNPSKSLRPFKSITLLSVQFRKIKAFEGSHSVTVSHVSLLF